MKFKLFILGLLLFLSVKGFTQSDSTYTENINGRWYRTTQSYDNSGVFLGKETKIIGKTGDTSEVQQLSFSYPINLTQEWGSYSATSINMFPVVKQVYSDFGSLWETISGGVYAVELSKLFANKYVNDSTVTTARLFIFGAKYADFNIIQLNNGRLRLRGIDNPATVGVDESTYQHGFVPRSENTVVISNLPATEDSKTIFNLKALKLLVPAQAASIDALISYITSNGSLTSNVYIHYLGQTVTGKPLFKDLENKVRLVVLD